MFIGQVTPPSPIRQGYYCAGKGADKAACAAQPGSYCPGTAAAGGAASPPGGVACDEGIYCLGGKADARTCEAPAGR